MLNLFHKLKYHIDIINVLKCAVVKRLMDEQLFKTEFCDPVALLWHNNAIAYFTYKIDGLVDADSYLEMYNFLLM